MTLTRNEFKTVRAWHRACIGEISGQDVILRHTSALEHLELFTGYVKENKIEVYAKSSACSAIINSRVINTFDSIDYVHFGNIRCTSASQTFNDMLNDYENIDEQPLIEGLSKYYYTHGNSFEGLSINPRHGERFNLIKSWAIEYYDEV